jgi:hypothetical protein
MRLFHWAGSLPLLLVIACGDAGTAPSAATFEPLSAATTAATPHFLTLAPNPPPLVSPTVQFWAVQGQDREASLYYTKRPGPPTNSDRLLRFRVDRRSLITDPNGNPLPPGDSVLITITVTDTLHQVIDFQPAGLTFNPQRPAVLSIWYLEANHDFNGDGVINAKDARLERTFRIWQQHAGQPYQPLPTRLTVSLDQAEANVAGFTRFAVAY